MQAKTVQKNAELKTEFDNLSIFATYSIEPKVAAVRFRQNIK